MSQPHVDMDGLIEHLKTAIPRRFPDEVAFVYYGDIGVYPPRAFANRNNEQRFVVVLEPEEDEEIPGTQSGAAEDRLLLVNIVTMVNLTPYIKALPDKAPAEKELTVFSTRLRKWLAQGENETLGGRVQFFRVGNVAWDTQKRGELAVRAMRIEGRARVHLRRDDAHA